MTTTNRLCYTVSKRYIQAGTTFKINVKILLADDCKNNICDWSITADIYEQRKNGRFVWCAGGCCHEEILKRFPQFKMFVDLHLSNHYGAPMYPVENGFYHITNSSKETAINYLRITETEYDLLQQAEDKQYFKYLLYMLGIVERWKRESNEALKKLEELTGQTWENPYKPENERFTLKLTDEERTTITNRINDGYYRPEAVQARKDNEIAMAKYTITNQKELRRSFWEFCKEFGGEFEREANKKKHSFKLDFNIAFGEYKDGLCKDGIISQSLYERATLY